MIVLVFYGSLCQILDSAYSPSPFFLRTSISVPVAPNRIIILASTYSLLLEFNLALLDNSLKAEFAITCLCAVAFVRDVTSSRIASRKIY